MYRIIRLSLGAILFVLASSATNLALCAESSLAAAASDWPVYRKDNIRSGSSEEKLDASSLGLLWKHSQSFFPQTAWHGPAKWNIFGGGKKQYPLRDYDTVFHPILVNRQVYFSSSVTNEVYCLDAKTGESKWTFPTLGTPRIAPAYHEGKLLFGCDLGYVYCLDATSGKQLWRFTPRPVNGEEELFFNNGRLTSPWACRTGVLVRQGKAYAAFASHPWHSKGRFASGSTAPDKDELSNKSNLLCAIDLETGIGEPVTSGSAKTYQGYMGEAGPYLFVPAGRGRAGLFTFPKDDSATQLAGQRGSEFTPHGQVSEDIYCFVGSHHGGISLLNAKTGQSFSITPGRRCVGTGQYFFVSSETTITCYAKKDLEHLFDKFEIASRGKKLSRNETKQLLAKLKKELKPAWKKAYVYPCELVAAGEVVLAGGYDRVAMIESATGKLLRELPVEGKAYGIAVARGKVIASTDDGKIYCFGTGGKALSKIDAAPPEVRLPRRPEKVVLSDYPFSAGPFIKFTGRETATVSWQADDASECVFRFGESRPSLELKAKLVDNWYQVQLTNLRNRRLYHCEIEVVSTAGKFKSKQFDLDTWFNFSMPEATMPEGDLGDRVAAALPLAQKHLKPCKTNRGVCLVVGVEGASFLHALAMESELRVIGLLPDDRRRQAIASELAMAGSYGSRVTLHVLPDFTRSDLPGGCANLLIVRPDHGIKNVSMDRVMHFLQPFNGVAVLSDEHVSGESLLVTNTEKATDLGSATSVVEHPGFSHLGQWTHQMGNSANTACSNDALQGVKSLTETRLQWMGRPGARFHVDRSPRCSGPLAKDGILFSEGIERVLALDNYNGEILWELEIPGFMRFNVPRNSSNYCTDGKRVFIASRDRAYALDARSGDVLASFKPVPRTDKPWATEWGYIGTHADLLLGTAVKTGEFPYTIAGKAGWYDGNGPVYKNNRKVLGDTLFAYEPVGKKPKWTYGKGLIINSTICAHNGRVSFLECMDKELLDGTKRMVLSPLLWEKAQLTTLDIKTGEVIHAMPAPKEMAPGYVMANISAKDNYLLLWTSCHDWLSENREALLKLDIEAGEQITVPSGGTGYYSLTCIDTRDWSVVWNNGDKSRWKGGHHGHHMKYPLVIENKIIAGMHTLDYRTGHLYSSHAPHKSCGAHASSLTGVYGGKFWCPLTREQSNPGYGRTNCWLSTIPANGLITSIEGSGGCSCLRGSPYMEVSYSMSARKPPAISFAMSDATFDGQVHVKLAKLLGYGTIRYTTDGSRPTHTSSAYPEATGILISENHLVQAALFVENRQVGDVISRKFEKIISTE